MQTTNAAHVVGHDANGNVMFLADAGDTTVSANFEYSPFGQVIQASGRMAHNPIRFSGKYQDPETQYNYYSYRYHQPETGRWLNRDPIGELGGNNIYTFLLNSGPNIVDAFGLISVPIEDLFSYSNRHQETWSVSMSMPAALSAALATWPGIDVSELDLSASGYKKNCLGCCINNQGSARSWSRGLSITGSSSASSIDERYRIPYLGNARVRGGLMIDVSAGGGISGGCNGCNERFFASGCVGININIGFGARIEFNSRYLLRFGGGFRIGIESQISACARGNFGFFEVYGNWCINGYFRYWADLPFGGQYRNQFSANTCISGTLFSI